MTPLACRKQLLQGGVGLVVIKQGFPENASSVFGNTGNPLSPCARTAEIQEHDGRTGTPCRDKAVLERDP